MQVLLLARPISGEPGTPPVALRRLGRALRRTGTTVNVDVTTVTRDDVEVSTVDLARELERRWATHPPDVVHAHGCVAAVAAFAAARGRVAVVVTFDEQPGQTPLERDLARRADALVVRSSADRDAWRVLQIPLTRVSVLPISADRHPAVSGHSGGTRLVVTDAHGEVLDRIVRSMPFWPGQTRLAVQSLLEPEEQRRVLALTRSLGLDGRVDVDPLLRDSGRSPWAKVALVLAGPDGSRHASLVVEGAARAVPAIAAEVDAHSDIVVDGATGLLLSPNSGPRAIGQAVDAFLADELRARGYGLAAQLRARAIHDPAVIAEQSLRVYARAVERAEARTRAVQPDAGPSDGPLDDAVRDLVLEHLPVARRVAQRYAGRGQAIGDLVQVACLGLVKAAQRFDPAQGTDFLSYAIPTMLGELRRYFRDNAWAVHVPRGLQEAALRVQHADDALRQDAGNEVTAADVATDLGVSVKEVLEARQVSGVAFSCRSLDAPLMDGTGEGLADLLGADDTTLDWIEDREALHAALARVPDREREILELRFFGEQTQSEIAAQLGISQMHVSRLLSRTLTTLREHVVDGAPLPPAWRPAASSPN